MANFRGNYGYLIVAMAVLAGYLRMSRANRIAATQVERRQSPYNLAVQKILASVLISAAFALAVFAVLHRERSWFWLAAVVAALSGGQALATALLPQERLATVIRMIGAAFIVLALVMYFMLIRG